MVGRFVLSRCGVDHAGHVAGAVGLGGWRIRLAIAVALVVIGHLNATKSCAITRIIARRKDV